MNEDRQSPRKYKNILYPLAALLVLIGAGLVIESCDTEKVEVCDTTTGECRFESSCRPLLFDLLT
ncbi:MAG TPA: hypothetical protein VJA87_01040 [Candidatus Paceibacterota bacterium]